MNSLAKLIITLQGNGDRLAVEKAQKTNGIIATELQGDLNRLGKKGIPVDLVFEQGVDVLGMVK